MAVLLREIGLTVNCMPALDLKLPGGSEIVGDRALGTDPMQVAALGRAALDGLRRGGVLGVIKHMPGHGRATVDSHHALPVVDADAEILESDLAPFRALNDAPIGMTAHILYSAWDRDRPATLSRIVVGDVIRTRIGYDGLLLSDDIGMGALSGAIGERAALALAAGCDLVLHCSGILGEMVELAGAVPQITSSGADRLQRALATISGQVGSDYEALAAKRDALLAYA
jgi:beta-N-acetylhexosaminidase